MALREGHEFALAGTPCEHAYEHDLLLVRRGARLRYPADAFLNAHGSTATSRSPCAAPTAARSATSA